MMWTILNRANVLRRKGQPRLDVLMSQLKRSGYCAFGIMVGLSSASVAYQVLPSIGVLISPAETVDDLQVVWFPVRIWATLIVARVSGAWAYGLLLRR
jgi:hypothetical protein